MDTKLLFALALLAALAVPPPYAEAASSHEGNPERLALSAPDKTGGKPLMQALALRASNRSISDRPLAEKTLSNLLWAAWGVNRPDGRRTVPTAQNQQAAALYVAMDNGVWRYDGATHELVKVLTEDTRASFGGAPVILIYAAEAGPYAGMHVGSMYQNAGLFCASEGLAGVVKGTGVTLLQNRLPLPPGYSILIVQPVGLPK
jgi:hypothetical protein